MSKWPLAMLPIKNNIFKLGLLCIFVCILPGCFKAKKNKENHNDMQREVSGFHAIQAKHADLPIPINTKICEDNCCYDELSNSLQLCYEYRASLSELKKYYREQMEYHGWQELSSIDGIETIMSFNKPNGKVCFVSLRPLKCSTSHMQVYMHSRWAVSG